MDPVLQRFGDVTIQRLEKPKEPKVGPQSDNSSLEKSKESKDENSSGLEDESGDEFPIPGLKRSLPSSEISMKNETEMSDYDTESEMEESEGELNELNASEVLNIKPIPNKDNSEDDASSSTSFLKTADGDEITGLPKGLAMRRNIREVMDETKLDESTLAAQRQEAERLRRVQEQQRLLRELQRQAAQERMQHKVISLLQGNQFSKPVKYRHPKKKLAEKKNTYIESNKDREYCTSETAKWSDKIHDKTSKRPFELVKVPKNATPPPMGAPKSNRNIPVAKKGGADLSHRYKKLFKTKPPVQTIDISSDDDCIVVSEPEGDEDEPEDDPGNSGMHTNDEFNQPDEHGRVLVNVGPPR
ncbi:hypothetical protein NQ318_019540 [Aromia moschata]|uniref:Uncharacterized protein n=1 Tax=Aromia moschata TaxID=1265417 RepID=A0AAV8XAU0_9CUCU|nr:hypothetical protein NQ318_019540 [Aromia moschata]